jgi:hypothetical protein
MSGVKGATNEMVRRKRKVMLLLPVIVIPLLTLGFYALGGGKGGNDGHGLVLTKGLNMSLPEAKFDAKKKGLTKLGFYKQSDQDSMKLRERRKMDPYYGWKDSSVAGLDAGLVNREAIGGMVRPGGPTGLKMEGPPTDVQAAELMRKLELLKGALSRQQPGIIPEMSPGGRYVGRDYSNGGTPLPYGSDGARLGSLSAAPGGGGRTGSLPAFAGEVARMGIVPPAAGADTFGARAFTPLGARTERPAAGDPDLDKLNAIMDKVLRVRYSGDAALHDTVPEVREGPSVQMLTTPQSSDVMTTLAVSSEDDLETGFIDLDAGPPADSLAENIIPAMVDGAQTVISGEAVALRTTGDAMLGGTRVPYGTALSGKATLSGERLMISVNAIRIGSRVIPVALEVVDMDGMTGIRVKGSINRDVSKESADEAVGSMGLTTVDPSVAGQATAAGLQAAKNLLSRKIRLVRVGLPAGYRVLLRNSKVNH